MFSNEVIHRLGCYIYRLIDPRNGSTFYVGKGFGNDIFNHINDDNTLKYSNETLDLKCHDIQNIKSVSLAPICIIHRHNLTFEQAVAAEAAIIDLYPHIDSSHLKSDLIQTGPLSINEVINRYEGC